MGIGSKLEFHHQETIMKYLAVLLLLLPFTFNGFEINLADSELIIAGTSTVRNWESIVTDFSVTGHWEGDQITDLHGTAEVLSIESGKTSDGHQNLQGTQTGGASSDRVNRR